MSKPIIIGPRPWWRHRIFPWGWRLLSEVNPDFTIDGLIKTNGYYTPNDGGGNVYVFVADENKWRNL